MMTRITTAIIAGLLLTTATVAQPLAQGQWKGGIELFDGTFTPGVSADRCLGNPGNPCPATYSLEMRNLNSEHLDVMVLCLAHDQNKKPFASATWTFIAVAPRETQQGLIVFHDVRGPADAARVCRGHLRGAVVGSGANHGTSTLSSMTDTGCAELSISAASNARPAMVRWSQHRVFPVID